MNKKIFIISGSEEQSRECARKNKLHAYYTSDDLTLVKGWGYHKGFNKDNCVIWFYGDYYMHQHYLYALHLKQKFDIPSYIIDDVYSFNYALLEGNETVH